MRLLIFGYMINFQKMCCSIFFLTAVSLGLSSCVRFDAGVVKNNGDKCPYYDNTKTAPGWITGKIKLKDYYAGVGSVTYIKDHDEQRKIAKDRAIADLIESVKVTVRREFNVETSQVVINGERSFSSESSRIISSISELEVNELEIHDTYFNKDCTMFICVRIEKRIVDNILKIEKAEAFYKKAESANLSMQDRMDFINQAIVMLNSINFDSLPADYGNMNTYQTRYHRLLTRLREESQATSAIFIIKATDQLPRDLTESLFKKCRARVLLKSLYEHDYNCIVLQQCLDKAKDNFATYLVLLNIDTDLSKRTMLWKASLEITPEIYDVEKGTRLIICDPVEDGMFAPNEEVEWERLVDKIFKADPFGAFFSYLNRLK